MNKERLKKINIIATVIFSVSYMLLLYYLFNIAKFRIVSSFFLAITSIIFTSVFFIYILFKMWKYEYEIFNTKSTIITISLAFLVYSFPIAYFILEFGREFAKTDSVQIGSADGWLGFIGSVFGSFITVLAIVFTLKKDESDIKVNIPEKRKSRLTSRPNHRLLNRKHLVLNRTKRNNHSN